ncbi:hypothetical protein WN943_016249 [Citrus x changshan-huyou]
MTKTFEDDLKYQQNFSACLMPVVLHLLVCQVRLQLQLIVDLILWRLRHPKGHDNFIAPSRLKNLVEMVDFEVLFYCSSAQFSIMLCHLNMFVSFAVGVRRFVSECGNW